MVGCRSIAVLCKHSAVRRRLQLGIVFVACVIAASPGWTSTEPSPLQPNILWILTEDHGPMLGAYGDAYANTPSIDELASKAVTYTRAYSNAPVCSPARSTLITGMYTNGLGSHNMPGPVQRPANIAFLSDYLRRAGYYTANIGKYDFNFLPGEEKWDEINQDIFATAWNPSEYLRNREDGQPFFTIINLFHSHESRVFSENFVPLDASENRKPHDPAQAPVPPYHPDSEAIRTDWARYYDNVSRVDHHVGQILDTLEREGLLEETIVFMFSDHGTGLPRGKRWLYESGLRVPLIVYFPESLVDLAPIVPGGRVDTLVSFVDFAPTVLSLAGLDVPPHMQGQAFLGSTSQKPRNYVFGYRDRMDGRADLIRSVTDGRYKYIRNFLPHRPYGQHIAFMYRQSAMQEWQRHHDMRALTPVQNTFFQPKPMEEFYDLASDPHEIHNLADKPEFAQHKRMLSSTLEQWMVEKHDLGLLPEGEIRARAGDRPPYEIGRELDVEVFRDLLRAASQASNTDPKKDVPVHLLDDERSAIRYWGVLGIHAFDRVDTALIERLTNLLNDPSMSVRIAAAEVLCAHNHCDTAIPLLVEALQHEDGAVRMMAANALDYLDEKTIPVRKDLEMARDANDIEPYYLISARGGLKETDAQALQNAVYSPLVKNVLDKALSDLGPAVSRN